MSKWCTKELEQSKAHSQSNGVTNACQFNRLEIIGNDRQKVLANRHQTRAEFESTSSVSAFHFVCTKKVNAAKYAHGI